MFRKLLLTSRLTLDSLLFVVVVVVVDVVSGFVGRRRVLLDVGANLEAQKGWISKMSQAKASTIKNDSKA